jgi:hypothetical protein
MDHVCSEGFRSVLLLFNGDVVRQVEPLDLISPCVLVDASSKSEGWWLSWERSLVVYNGDGRSAGLIFAVRYQKRSLEYFQSTSRMKSACCSLAEPLNRT